MKSSIILAILLVLELLNGRAAFAQDILLQTRVAQGTLSALIDKTRILLNNAEVDDNLSGTVELGDDILFTLDELGIDMQSSKIKKSFQSLFKIDLKDASLRIRIPKVGYAIQKLTARPEKMNVVDPVLSLDVTAFVQGLKTSLNEGIEMDLMMVNPKTKVSESYLTARLNPTQVSIPESLDALSFGVEFETLRGEELIFNLKNQDFSGIPGYVNRNFKQFLLDDLTLKQPFSSNSLTINPVIIRLNTLSRTVTFDEFKPLFQKNLDRIVALIFEKLGRSLQKNILPNIMSKLFSHRTRSDFIVSNENIYTRFITNQFDQPLSDQLLLGIQGELCTAEKYQLFREQCHQQVGIPGPIRSISEGDRQMAKSEITESIARGSSDMILSLSEEYLNRLLFTTIQAKLWDASLSGQNLALGPKGAFLVFNQKTDQPELYLDLLYLGEGRTQKLFVNERKPIRFPLRISTSMKFEVKDGVPHLVISTQRILSDMNEIIHGIPEYEMKSKLIRGFKKKIAKMILKMSKDIEGKAAVDLDLPILKNIEIEKTRIEASAFGRLNLSFQL